VFSKDSRFGNFPSVGLGWKIRKRFYERPFCLSQLKLRASYGLSGNSNIPQLVPSVWKGQANNIVYSLGPSKAYAQGATVNSAVSPNNRWEPPGSLMLVWMPLPGRPRHGERGIL